MPPRRGRALTEREAKLNWTAIGVHCLLLLTFGGVWAWHLTPKANEQEVAQKQGWFWQYYTFLGFSLQLLQFSLALIADLIPKKGILQLSDTVSCAIMPVAVFITQFYYCLLLTGNIVDEDDVPSWVSPALHTGNFAGLIADWAVSRKQRTFPASSSILLASINIAYMAYCYYLRLLNGEYPYAFLQKAPEPWGIVGSAIVLVLAAEANFILLRQIKAWKKLAR